jgi:hypothetical protein
MKPNDVGNIPQVIGVWHMELDPMHYQANSVYPPSYEP